MEDGIIISDYFSKEKENNKNEENKKQKDDIITITNKNENNIIEIENALDNDDIKIISLEEEKMMKIEIPKDIIKEKERANKLTLKNC